MVKITLDVLVSKSEVKLSKNLLCDNSYVNVEEKIIYENLTSGKILIKYSNMFITIKFFLFNFLFFNRRFYSIVGECIRYSIRWNIFIKMTFYTQTRHSVNKSINCPYVTSMKFAEVLDRLKYAKVNRIEKKNKYASKLFSMLAIFITFN